MANVDDVVRTLVTLSKHDGATAASVVKGLKAEYKHVPPKKLNKLMQQAGAIIRKAQK